jgi:hypothetical protein
VYASSWRKGALRENGVAQAARHLRPAAATRISGDAIRLRPFPAAESGLARRRDVGLTFARRPGEVFSSHLPTLAWAVTPESLATVAGATANRSGHFAIQRVRY